MPLNKDAASAGKVMTTMAPYPVVPVPDDWSRPYWEGAKEQKLMIQRCQSCGHYNHPPQFICLGCKERDTTLEFEPVSGKGTVYAWFIHHDTQVGGFEDRAPYLVAAIELEEQPRLLLTTNLLNIAFDEVELGMPVEVVWEKANDDITVPQFQPSPS